MVSVNEATQNANAQDGPRVSELTPGQVFTGRYACARKDRMTSKNGSAYLNLELRDRTGSIPARIFREVDQIGQRFEQGDAIRVRGKVERFRGILSAELENVEKLEGPGVDPTEFIRSGGTIYVIGSEQDAAAQASLITAFVQEVLDSARRLAIAGSLSLIHISEPTRPY